MRKKISESEKKKSVAICLHPEILKLLEEESKNLNKNKSKIIESILKKYFENN